MSANRTYSIMANPITTGVAGAIGGLTVGYLAASIKKRKSSRKSKNRKKRSYRKSTKRYRRTPYTAGKRKDTSHRRIRYTKNGQPYIILRSGKARFIKKKSAKTSRKRRGGRY